LFQTKTMLARGNIAIEQALQFPLLELLSTFNLESRITDAFCTKKKRGGKGESCEKERATKKQNTNQARNSKHTMIPPSPSLSANDIFTRWSSYFSCFRTLRASCIASYQVQALCSNTHALSSTHSIIALSDPLLQVSDILHSLLSRSPGTVKERLQAHSQENRLSLRELCNGRCLKVSESFE